MGKAPHKQIAAGMFAVVMLTAVFVALGTPELVYAQETGVGGIEQNLEQFGEATQLGGESIVVIVARIIRAVFALLGIIAVALIIYAGVVWMTSGGNEEKVETAKKILRNAVIGLAITLSAFTITHFIIRALVGATGGDVSDGADGVTGGPGAGFEGGGQLGSVIQDHWPKRSAPWPGEPSIPRNTKIVITFKKGITLKADTFIVDANNDGKFGAVVTAADGSVSLDQINAANIKIFKTAEGDAGALAQNPDAPEDDVAVVALTQSFSDGGTQTILTFIPKQPLGSPSEAVQYTVLLDPDLKQLDAKGKEAPLFTGSETKYEWSFTVSNILDLTPPQVQSVVPSFGKEHPKNAIIQVTFDEPVDPISASGLFDPADQQSFQNITVGASTLTAPKTFVAGEFRISNGYKTVEFTSKEACGKNACGGAIFCLPGSSSIELNVKAAAVDPAAAPQAVIIGAGLYNGVVDMAGNSLDGGGEKGNEADGKAQGPPDDNFLWRFTTSANVDLTTPKLTALAPAFSATGISPSAPVEMTFSKVMSFSSLSANAALKTSNDPAATKLKNPWWFTSAQNLTSAGVPAASPDDSAVATKGVINHGNFLPETSYFPHIPSTVTDLYQNCFFPAVGEGAAACTATEDKPYCCNGVSSPSSCVFSPPIVE